MSRVVGSVLVAVGAIGLLSLLVGFPGAVSVPAADRVSARLSRLTPGMTEAQAMAALGLARRVHPTIGNGSWEDYGVVYPLRPGMNLALFLDMPPMYKPGGASPAFSLVSAERPARLLRGEVAGTDDEDRWTGAAFLLLTGLGLGLLSRRRKGAESHGPVEAL